MKRPKSAARRQSSATMRCGASRTRSSTARWSRSQLLLVLEFSSASRATAASAPALSALALGAADATPAVAAARLQLRRNAPIAAFGRALEEQRLARHRRDRRRLERLGDQERRLGPLAGEEALGIGGDEDHRRFESCEQLVDRLESRTAIGELDVREDQPRSLVLGQRESLRVSARNTEHPVTEAFHQGFELH